MNTQKTWLVTGISSGLGKALAEAIIAQGDVVIGTVRSKTEAEQFQQRYPQNGFAVKMDLTQPQEMEEAFQKISHQFTTIDVLVNNAGFGFAGAVEETSLEEVRSVFEANFFGTLQWTQLFLPLMRKKRSGHIIQISSHGGFKAFPGFGIYNASKFALEGVSEALAQELAPLGIKVTIVEPGPFRTSFAGRSFKQSHKVIEDYNTTAGIFRERMQQIDGKQEGDPVKAAQAIINITKLNTVPLRLPLGKIAIQTLQTKLNSVQEDLNKFKEVAESVVFE